MKKTIEDLKSLLGGLAGHDLSDASSTESFLNLGFDSLFLTQAATAIKNKFGVKITFRQLMVELTTLEVLATYLDEKRAGSGLTQMHAVPASSPQPAASSTASPEHPRSNPSLPASSRDSHEKPANETMTERVVREQMRLMERQLDLLKRSSSSPANRMLSAPPIEVAPLPPKSAPAAPLLATNGTTPLTPPVAARSSVQSLSPHQQAYLDALIARYTKRTAGSKKLTQQYRQWYADPRTASGFNPLWKEMVYQIVVTRSSGSRLWDIDGNEYIDMLNGFGPNFIGHSADVITDALKEQLDKGIEVGPQFPLAGETAKLFCELTGNERASFVCTGSEAVYAAMRLARTATGRNKIVVFTKDYHGNFDEVLVRAAGTPGQVRSIPSAPGIPSRAVEDMYVLDYGTDTALEFIRTHANEIAAVLVEPVQSRRPEWRPKEFITALRQITTEHECLLIFDEVITGLRSGPRGAQEYYGITADLATYGKVVAGGMPIGIVAGKAEYMDIFDGGHWQYGDDSFPTTGVTFFAGTFVRHPLVIAATHAMLKYLKAQGPELWETLNRRSARLADTLDAFFIEKNIPVRIPHFGSLFFVRLGEDQKYGNLLFYLLREKGVFLLEPFPSYLTVAHTEEDIDRIIAAFKESALELKELGFFSGPPDKPGAALTNNPPPVVQAVAAPAQVAGSPGTAPVASTPAPSTTDRFPLAEGQREMWLGAQMSPDAAGPHHACTLVDFDGAFDPAALRHAMAVVINRHEGLRCVFSEDGTEVIVRPTLNLDVPLDDLSGLPAAERKEAGERIVHQEARQIFDLANGPLIAARIIRFSATQHQLVFTAQMIACDGWSHYIVFEELGAYYSAYVEGKGEPSLPPATPMREYALWQEKNNSSDESRASQAFWLSKFKNIPPALDLPTAGPRPPHRTVAADRREVTFAPDFYNAIKTLAKDQKNSSFALLLATFQAWLHRLSGATDLVVGVPFSAQGQLGFDVLVGQCANTLPLRTQLDPDEPFTTLLKRTWADLLDAQENWNYTFGKLAEQLDIPRDPSRIPLVSVLFNIDPPMSKVGFARLKHRFSSGPRLYYQYDLGFNLVEDEGSLRVECDYNRNLFDGATVQAWLSSYETLLRRLVTTPSQSIAKLPMATGIPSLTKESLPGEEQLTIHGMIQVQMDRTPDAVAVVDGFGRMTYAELNRKANSLAGYLTQLGVGPNSIVALCLESKADVLVAILAVLRIGAAYAPLALELPPERKALILKDANATVILTHASLLETLPSTSTKPICLDRDWATIEASPVTRKEIKPNPNSRAYLIYTSGSTGHPKGIEISHRAAVNFLISMQREPGLNGKDTVLALHPLSFDISVLELLLPLTVGAHTVIAARTTVTDPTKLGELIRTSGVNVIQATPSTWRMLFNSGWKGRKGLRLLTGGEALTPDLANQLIATGSEIWNMYGPTETTVWSTANKVEPTAALSIGTPIRNTKLHIVDKNLEPVPLGVPGELLVEGEGLAIGYLHQPALTAEKFVSDPFSKDPRARLYRTGDLARWRSDGSIEYLGRLDFQVKLRGHRIELGEIETALLAMPEIKQAVVSLQTDIQGNQKLAAHIVKNGETPMELWLASPSVGKHQLYDDLMYEIMSNDEARNDCFAAAFKRTLQGKILLDIGTGKDAILARLAIEAGARKVYAIEILEEPYRQAKALVQKLGLQDRIEVLLGDASKVALPEKADGCVAEIIGTIGGAEGLEKLLGMCRGQLKSQGTVIPARVLTRIAAVELPETFRANPTFAPLAGENAKQVFEAAGYRFDPRLSISGTTEQHLRSTSEIFEECDFTASNSPDYNRTMKLRITKDASLDGFLLWLEIQMTPEDIFLGLSNQKSWLPVFFPVFDPPLQVGAGDTIEAVATGEGSANGWNKDYSFVGRVIRVSGETVLFHFDSKHAAGTYRGTPFYQRLFANDHIPSKALGGGPNSVASIRNALRKNLPEFMIPETFMFLDNLPLTPNGKIDRKALSASDTKAHTSNLIIAPRNRTESRLTAIFAKVLAHPVASVTDSFFDLGGHSLLAVKLMAAIEQDFGVRIPLSKLFSAPTIEKLGQLLDRPKAIEKTWPSLVPIQPKVGKPALFLVHGAGGNVLLYRELAEAIGAEVSVYGFQSQGLDNQSRPLETVEEMAAHYLKEMRAVQPHGPYHLGGYCMGGTIAYEMAQRLHQSGEEVALVAMLDTYNFSRALKVGFFSFLLEKLKFHFTNFIGLRPRNMWGYLVEKARVAEDGELANLLNSKPKPGAQEDFARATSGPEASVQALNDQAATIYLPKHYPGRLTLFKPAKNYKFYPDPNMGWSDLVGGGLEIVEFPFNPHAMLVEPYVALLAKALRKSMSVAGKKQINESQAEIEAPFKTVRASSG